MNKIMIILLYSMQFRRMEEWRISDWGTGKNLEGIRPATWRGTNKRILWTRLGRVWFQSKLFSLLNQKESIIVAKLKRNTPFHACMRIYTCVCVCVYMYIHVSLDELRIFSRVRHIVAADWNPHDVPRLLSSTFVPLTNHLDASKPYALRMVFIKWRIMQTLGPRRWSFSFGFLLVKQNRGWSCVSILGNANDRFVFELSTKMDQKFSDWTINFIHFFLRSVRWIMILYHSSDY